MPRRRIPPWGESLDRWPFLRRVSGPFGGSTGPDGRNDDTRFRMKGFWLRILWLGSDHLERMFAVDRFESPKLAVGDRFRHNVIAKENVDPPGGVHADFESFFEQDVAGK
jgi:hypothetical protein